MRKRTHDELEYDLPESCSEYDDYDDDDDELDDDDTVSADDDSLDRDAEQDTKIVRTRKRIINARIYTGLEPLVVNEELCLRIMTMDIKEGLDKNGYATDNEQNTCITPFNFIHPVPMIGMSHRFLIHRHYVVRRKESARVMAFQALFAKVYLREWLHLTGHPVDAVHPGLPPRRPLLELGVTDFDINDESSYTQGTVTEKADLVIDISRQMYKFKPQLRKLIKGAKRPTAYNWPPEECAAHDLAEMKSMAVLARSILTNCPEMQSAIPVRLEYTDGEPFALARPHWGILMRYAGGENALLRVALFLHGSNPDCDSLGRKGDQYQPFRGSPPCRGTVFGMPFAKINKFQDQPLLSCADVDRRKPVYYPTRRGERRLYAYEDEWVGRRFQHCWAFATQTENLDITIPVILLLQKSARGAFPYHKDI